jgi:hypothetical protein
MATVVGLFDSTSQAQAAVEQLRASGIAASDIGVAMRSAAGTAGTEVITDTGAAGGAVTGAVGGGVLGGLAGLLVGIGALAIPGVGPIVAAGPLATTLVGAGIGAATGGLLGALVDAGVPEEEARLYQTGVERGGVLVTARVPDGQEMKAQNILNSAGAHDIRNEASMYSNPNYRYGTTTANYATTGPAYDRETTMSGQHDDKTSEAVGGGAGALAGGVIGGAVAGPPGAVAGAAIGGAGGAVAADAAQGDDDAVGAGAGGAGGAIAGGAIGGAVGGPIGAAAGAAIGAGAGAAGGEKAEEEIKDDTGMRDVEPYDTNYSNRNTTDTTY